jgi:hypothetical protein
MLTECPHCFTRVLPRPDGQCPACQQSTVDVRDADREFRTVTVRESSHMPDFCCSCMLPERRLVRIARSRVVWGSGGDSGAAAVVAMVLHGLLGGLTGFVRMLHSDKSSGAQKVVVQVRQCRPCSRRLPLEPVFVNYDGYNMKFVVHRDFAKMFGELNDKAARSS